MGRKQTFLKTHNNFQQTHHLFKLDEFYETAKGLMMRESTVRHRCWPLSLHSTPTPTNLLSAILSLWAWSRRFSGHWPRVLTTAVLWPRGVMQRQFAPTSPWFPINTASLIRPSRGVSSWSQMERGCGRGDGWRGQKSKVQVLKFRNSCEKYRSGAVGHTRLH